MELERKRLPFTLKADGNEGEFRAVFATFDVVDHDGDITRPGAFKDGSEVIIGSWGHKTHELPVGKGRIVTDQKEAAVEGSFFLDTQPGRDTYQTVKNLGPLGEWSYVFSIKRWEIERSEGSYHRVLHELDVYSVDPVLAGAGIDTRTTAIKSRRDMPFLDHSEEIEELIVEFAARAKERSAIREKEGRMLSSGNVDRLKAIAESLKGAAGDLEKLLEAAEPKGDEKSSDELRRELLRFQRHLLIGA